MLTQILVIEFIQKMMYDQKPFILAQLIIKMLVGVLIALVIPTLGDLGISSASLDTVKEGLEGVQEVEFLSSLPATFDEDFDDVQEVKTLSELSESNVEDYDDAFSEVSDSEIQEVTSISQISSLESSSKAVSDSDDQDDSDDLSSIGKVKENALGLSLFDTGDAPSLSSGCQASCKELMGEEFDLCVDKYCPPPPPEESYYLTAILVVALGFAGAYYLKKCLRSNKTRTYLLTEDPELHYKRL